MKTITIYDLKEKLKGSTIGEVIEWARGMKPMYPSCKVKKPTLLPNHTVEQIDAYREAFKEYTKANEIYQKEKQEFQDASTAIDNAVEEFIKEESGLLDLPEDKRNKVWAKAYEDRHGSGFLEVYHELCDLVDLVK